MLIPIALLEPYTSVFFLTPPQRSHLVAYCQQFIQRAFGLDATIFQHDDVIGLAQCHAAMRDDEAGGPIGGSSPIGK